MKKTLAGRFLLAIFLINIALGCAQKNEQVNDYDKVLNAVSERFSKGDYVGFPSSDNPHDQIGKTIQRIHQNILRTPDALPTRLQFGIKIGTENPKKWSHVKSISAELLKKEGYNFDEAYADRLNTKMIAYDLTSEGVTRLLDQYETEKTLTPFQNKLIKVELQQVVSATSNSQLKKIMSSVEFEVYNSNIDNDSKNKLLFMNAVMRNLCTDSRSREENETSPFIKTGVPVIAAVLAVIGLTAIIEAFTAPNCNQSCQSNLIAFGATSLMTAGITCCCADAAYYDPCFPNTKN